MKEQENFPELDEMEVNSSSNRQFRVMMIRIFNNIKKDIETIKRISQK